MVQELESQLGFKRNLNPFLEVRTPLSPSHCLSLYLSSSPCGHWCSYLCMFVTSPISSSCCFSPPLTPHPPRRPAFSTSLYTVQIGLIETQFSYLLRDNS